MGFSAAAGHIRCFLLFVLGTGGVAWDPEATPPKPRVGHFLLALSAPAPLSSLVMGPPRRQLLLGLQRAARLATRLEASEDPEVNLERALQSQAKMLRERRIQKQMEPRGPPQRTLTRQAMEQIRFLSWESPEEWPVDRLARGFRVPPDVITRVLRSRFQPSPSRATKQDAVVTATITQKSEPTHKKPQKGREVFDTMGNLLYRIPEGSSPPLLALGPGRKTRPK
ncbi:neugrin [Anolis sagrei]|uniref:neugrin n=1 Tax=Anolis sagrei TaxID=38937 RepID=UPI00352285E1